MGTGGLKKGDGQMAQGKLGFGFMRLPVIDGVQENIDLEQLNQMVDEFLGTDSHISIQVMPITMVKAKRR